MGVCWLKKKGFLYDLKKNKILLLMFLPTLVWFAIFEYAPMAGIVMAFKKYNFSLGILKSPWCGLENFEFIFRSGRLGKLLWNTVSINFLFLVIGMFVQILLAILFSEITMKRFTKVTQMFICIPYFISWVVVGSVVYNMLNYNYGFVNTVLVKLGFERFDFYSNVPIWRYILIFFNTWKGMGYGSVVYLATVTGMDSEIYEAAQIDGATIWQRIWKITLPCLKPTIITMFLLSMGSLFRGNYQVFANIIGGNSLVMQELDVLDTYIIGAMMSGTNFGMSAAASMFQSIICFISVFIMNRVAKKVNENSALF